MADLDLRDLREKQKEIRRQDRSAAETRKDYCRRSDGFFEDGHYETSKDYSQHALDRKY